MKKLLYIGNKLSGHGNTPTAIEILGPLLEGEGFSVVYASTQKSKVLRLFDMLWQTFSNKAVADYVLIDTYSTYNFWYAFLVSQLCRMLHLKYIPILHGGALPGRLKANPKLCRMIFNNAIINVAPSNYLVKEFVFAGYNNVIFIPNPVVLDNFKFTQRETILPRLLWVRSLSPIYNPEMAIRAAAILKKSFLDVRLTMVGPDKAGMLPNLQKLADDLAVTIIFTGRIEKDAWAVLSEEYSIFINTSHVDNAPYSLIEAAALGLPIVSTNVGGIPYLFSHGVNAMLVNDNEPGEMAASITQIINDKVLKDKIVGAAYALSQEFCWDDIKSKWLHILT